MIPERLSRAETGGSRAVIGALAGHTREEPDADSVLVSGSQVRFPRMGVSCSKPGDRKMICHGGQKGGRRAGRC